MGNSESEEHQTYITVQQPVSNSTVAQLTQ